MNSENIQRFRDTLSSAKNCMQALAKSLSGLNECIAAGRLISDDALDVAIGELTACKAQWQELRSAAAALSISSDITLAEMDAAAEAIEQSERLNRIRVAVHDFFRLTSNVAETLNVIEQHKQKLIALCTHMDGDGEESIYPYNVVVHAVRSKNGLSDDEYTLVSDRLGRDMVRAVDRNRVVLDEQADIGVYLDGSCELLRCEGKTDTQSGVADREPNDSDAKSQQTMDVDPEAETSANAQSDERVCELPNTAPGWEGFTGYIDSSIAMHIEGDSPASDASASKYLRYIKENMDRMIAAPYIIAHMRMIPAQRDEAFYAEHKYPPLSSIDYLYGKGYLANYVFVERGMTSKYTVLSSKGMACLKKPDVVRRIKNCPPPKRSFVLEKDFAEFPSAWSRPFAYRCKMIADYAAQVNLHGYYDIRHGYLFEHFAYACVPGKPTGGYMIVPFAVAHGEEQAMADVVTDYLNDEVAAERHTPVLILVRSKDDIPVLSRNLCSTRPDNFSSLLYAVATEPERIMDGLLNPAALPLTY